MFICSWKNLENKINDKRTRVLSAWEELKTIVSLIDVELTWLNRLNESVEKHKTQKFTEHKNLPNLINNFEVSILNIFVFITLH